MANPGSNDDEILKRARARFTLAAEAEADVRKEAVEDLKFISGDQWPEDVKTARENEKRPCLTINRLPPYVRNVTNEQRQNRPAIKVNPVDDHGDAETAEILQGMVRHIEYDSSAEIAYDTAFESQVRGGFGYWRITTDYLDPLSFEQKIMIKRIRDAFQVYMDPNACEPDGSDSAWGFVIEDMSREAYNMAFPGTGLSKIDDWAAVGSSTSGWMSKDNVRVAEYYEKTFVKTKILKLSNGQVIREDKLAKLKPELLKIMRGEMPLPEGLSPDQVPSIVDERESNIPEVNWYKINGLEILDKTKIFGPFIPLIPAYGDEFFINGKRILESIVRHAKDPQRMYNYWETAKTELIALAPKAPFIGPEGSFEDYEEQWKTANIKSHPYLEYKIVYTAGGQPMPAPQRNVWEPPIQAITASEANAAEDIKATTGIFDAPLGNVSNELSGVAIQRRTQQSNIANYHFGDNFKRSLRHAGRIIIAMIPEIYDAPQAVRVLGDDGQQRIVRINEMFNKGGKQTIYQLNKGRYDVTVDTGPSFQTKRQEATASMLDLTRSVPESMKFALDLLVNNMDWPGKEEVAERIRKTLPPGLVEQKDDKKQPVPPEAQAAMTKMSQLLQQQSEVIGQQDEVIRTKKLELESKERIELQRQRTELVIEQMKHESTHAQLGFKMDVEMIQKRLDLLNDQSKLVSSDGNGPSAALPSNENQPPPGGPPPA